MLRSKTLTSSSNTQISSCFSLHSLARLFRWHCVCWIAASIAFRRLFCIAKSAVKVNTPLCSLAFNPVLLVSASDGGGATVGDPSSGVRRAEVSDAIDCARLGDLVWILNCSNCRAARRPCELKPRLRFTCSHSVRKLLQWVSALP